MLTNDRTHWGRDRTRTEIPFRAETRRRTDIHENQNGYAGMFRGLVYGNVFVFSRTKITRGKQLIGLFSPLYT